MRVTRLRFCLGIVCPGCGSRAGVLLVSAWRCFRPGLFGGVVVVLAVALVGAAVFLCPQMALIGADGRGGSGNGQWTGDSGERGGVGTEGTEGTDGEGLAPLGVEGMEPVGWRRVEERGEELGVGMDSGQGTVENGAVAGEGRGDRVGALLAEVFGGGVDESVCAVSGDGTGPVFGGAAGRVGLEQEVVVMGAARKIELGRRVKLLGVLREVEEGVLVSASKEGPVPNVGSALCIAVDLEEAWKLGDRVDLRRVAVHMAIEAIRIAGELGER